MTSTRSPLARSNAKTHWLITDEQGQSFTETCHGGGFGAWSKMVDRIAAQACPEIPQPRLIADTQDDELVFGSFDKAHQGTRTLTIVQVQKL